MKLNFRFKENLKSFFFLYLFFFLLIIQSNIQIVNSLSMDNYNNRLVTEELRLKIPSEFKEVWIEAEKSIWEPWLSNQDGFLGRQIFWDKDKEEALILVNWKNKELWKSISIEEVNLMQTRFEERVEKSLNLKVNPFKLIYEGELYKEA